MLEAYGDTLTKLLHIIETTNRGRFKFHELPELACTAIIEVYGPGTYPTKSEVKRLVASALEHLAERYPYSQVHLKKGT